MKARIHFEAPCRYTAFFWNPKRCCLKIGWLPKFPSNKLPSALEKLVFISAFKKPASHPRRPYF